MRTRYIHELNAVHQDVVEMGETTLSLLDEVLSAIADPNPGPSERASELEALTDHQHRLIHEKCLILIALQAPVAGDARLLTGILDAIVDLELIGDYAYEIVTLTEGLDKRPPVEILNRMHEAAGKVRDGLSIAIDSWRKRDRELAMSVRPLEGPIRGECQSLYSALAQLVSTPGEGAAFVDLMLICKHLERILRHAVCIADQSADAAPLSHTI